MSLWKGLNKISYRLMMAFSGMTGIGKTSRKNMSAVNPKVSFYSLSAVANNGQRFDFDQLRGKYVLLVNLASQCGFTPQYDDLEKLYRDYQDRLIVLGFPSNDFGAQEPGSDEEIAQFCRVNYGVSFPLFKKDAVSGTDMQPVYQWLSDAEKNGWNSQSPTWNFCKYLVDKDGALLHFYSASVSPMDGQITDQLAA